MADFSRLDRYMDSLKAEYNVPGCDVSVWKDHKEIYRHWAGERHPGVPMDGTEHYFYYSVSKITTMVATLKLIEEGKLHFDDTVDKFLPAYKNLTYIAKDGSIKPVSHVMTIEECMLMTSGMDYDLTAEPIKKLLSEYGRKATTRQIMDAFAEKPLLFDPGSDYLYSMSHDLLGAVIEVVSGMSFEEYLQKNIFGPLGISQITFHPSIEVQESMTKYAPTIDEKHNEMVPIGDHIENNVFVVSDGHESGGAGLVGPVWEYIKIMDMLACGGLGAAGERILKPETVDLCTVNRLTQYQIEHGWRKGQPTNFFGYGWGYCGRVLMDGTHKYSRSPKGEFGWCGAAGCYGMADVTNGLSIFYGEHCFGFNHVSEAYIHPGIRDLVYDILGL